MTEAIELRIGTAEIRWITLTCPQCGAGTSIDLREARQARAWEEGRALACGVCQAAFDREIKRGLVSLREGLALLDGHQVVAAQVRIPQERPR